MKLSRLTLIAKLEDLIRDARDSKEDDFAFDLNEVLYHYVKLMRWTTP